jgi:hypothetical protein
VSEHIGPQTQTSARRHESGLFADMILHAREAANIIQPDVMHRVSRCHLVPNILLIGDNTGNTYHQWLMAFAPQTDAGGEGISARAQERSLLSSRMESFTKLPKDWGGEDTILVNQQTFLVNQQTLDGAKRLIRELPNKWPLPQATPSPEGEIALTWFKGGNRLEVLLQPDRHLIWVVKNDGAYVPGRDIDLNAVASFSGLFEAIALFYECSVTTKRAPASRRLHPLRLDQWRAAKS